MTTMLLASMEFENQRPAKATIVDVLNEDCWRIILGYIHIKDIIRSERVSRKWQNVILQYLQGTHISIEGPFSNKLTMHKLRVIKLKNVNHPRELDQITRKWGPNIKKAVYYNKAGLEILARNCPNLEHILVLDIEDDVILNVAQPQENFKKLKTLHIETCSNNITDECISKWIGKVIEELYIRKALVVRDTLTGQFLVDIETNLRTLSLSNCPALKFQYLLSAVDRLTGLRKLELIELQTEIYLNIHKFLGKLPNLEDLCLRRAKPFDRELAEAISRLELKRLDLSYNELLNDERLEIIARGCGRLQELDVKRCFEVTVRGISAVCRVAGPALRALHVGSNPKVYDHRLETFITACPNLTLPDLSYSMAIADNFRDIGCSGYFPVIAGSACNNENFF